jgi:histidinol-phosphate phosphatase family protein
MKKAKAVFLDRDGVINKYPGDKEYVKSWSEFHFLPRVKLALHSLNKRGFKIFIISNQAGVLKGVYSKENLKQITRNMLKELSDSGINISGVFYCMHRKEDNCSCRKPKTGLIDMAISKLKDDNLNLALSESYFIGDTITDIEAGKSVGLKTILVFSGKENPDNKNNWQVQPDFATQDLCEAVEKILKS